MDTASRPPESDTPKLSPAYSRSQSLGSELGKPSVLSPAYTKSSSLSPEPGNTSERMDSRLILRMFRRMGSAQGVRESDILEALLQLRNSSNRAFLEAHLQGMFQKADHDNNGILSLKEFGHMVESSTIMQEAIHELDSVAEDLRVYEGRAFFGESVMQRIVSTAILVNILVMTISTDVSPNWIGWLWFELCFVTVFLTEIPVAIFYAARHSLGSPKPGVLSKLRFARHGAWLYLHDPMNIFDMTVTFCATLDVLAHVLPLPNAANLTVLRVLRLLRLARIGKLMRVSKDLLLLMCSLVAGFRSVMYSVLLVALLCLVLAITLRQNLTSTEGSPLIEIFPNVPTSMVVIGRCLVLRSEGACLDSDNIPLYTRLSGEMGLMFQIPWVFCETFIILGLLNVVSSIFFVKTITEGKKLDRTISMYGAISDNDALMRLDTLLKSLIHPKRKGNDNSMRNITNVVSDIQRQYPEITTKIPDLAKSVGQFATDIKSSREQYMSAMTQYNAEETTACAKLRMVPSAKTFYVNGKEELFIDGEDLQQNNQGGFGLTFAPLDACEVLPMQEQGSISDLIEEAREVLQLFKTKILPGSRWARDLSAGESPQGIWQESNNLCDLAVDPGPKGRSRASEKVETKYKGICERNHDYARLGLVYDSASHLLKGLKNLLRYRMKVDGVQVFGIKNRFATPTALGWQDISLTVKVRVPSSGRCHIMEVQLQLKRLVQVRDSAHKFYSMIRGLLPSDVLARIIDQLITNDLLDLNMTEKEWLSCLQNRNVTAILDELQIPRDDWQSLVQNVDADGNGTVSSIELRDGLLMSKSPLRTRDIMAMKLKIEHMSEFFISRLDRQLHEVQGMMHEHTHCLLAQLRGEQDTLGGIEFENGQGRQGVAL